MKLKNLFLSFIIFSLALPVQLLSQAQGTSILDVVQAHKPGEFFYFRGQAFMLTNAGVTSLAGIEQIEGIDRVKAINLSGNNFDIIKANTFNYPVFKDLKVLNLSNSNINLVDSDALHGLERLEVLSLENNNLESLADGALSGLENLKYIYIANNPGIGMLKNQIQKQLPKVTVYTVSLSRQRLNRIATAIGIGLTILAGALLWKYAGKGKTPAEKPKVYSIEYFQKKLSSYPEYKKGSSPGELLILAQYKSALSDKEFEKLLNLVIQDEGNLRELLEGLIQYEQNHYRKEILQQELSKLPQ